jgi:hypothetical protein
VSTPEPRYNPDNDGPRETEQLRRCDDNFSSDCRDDGQYQVWDRETNLFLNLCLPCRRAYENREFNHDQRFPHTEGGVVYHEQQVRR